jgi:hypothetical protein
MSQDEFSLHTSKGSRQTSLPSAAPIPDAQGQHSNFTADLWRKANHANPPIPLDLNAFEVAQTAVGVGRIHKIRR